MRDDGRPGEWRVRRSSVLIAGVLVLLAAALAGWWGLSASAEVQSGSFQSGSTGHPDECAFPDDDFWALFARDEEVVAMLTVRSDSRWPVEVTSLRPEAFRFDRRVVGPEDGFTFHDPSDGPPPEAETAERVVIPPGSEAALWIVSPLDDVLAGADGRVGVSQAPVRIRSLGIARDTTIDFDRSLWISGLDSDSAEFQHQVEGLCAS
ncbi:hypothetical protein [Krasilnikoviella flava]|uniref:hypothetical protein n=1 Tax=Krasilnikoviella flava TaxID=526729 RepID=UPI00111C724A|nr:hypothetical protein [Krasilnikoviella flava]